MNKRDELTERIMELNPDVIQITEIFPKRKGTTEINCDIEFSLPGYCKPIVNKNPSRGILILVKENIDVKVNNEMSDFKESLFCNITINDINILLGCIYRSGSDNKEQSTDDLIKLLEQADKQKYDKIIINGDFNYPEIDWLDESKATGNDEKFLNCLKDLFLNQMVQKPTRHRIGQKSNLLDLCLTNDDLFISNIEHMAPMGKSDHDVLLISLDTPKPKDTNTEPRYNFFKTNFTAFKEFASNQEWSNLDNMDLNDSWLYFTNFLHEGIDKFVPKSKPPKRRQPIWMNPKALKCIKKKYILYKRYLTSHTHYDYQRYLEIRNETKREIRRAVKEYERNVAKNSKSNSKAFWKYVNNKLKRPTGISNLKNGDKLTKSDEEKANVLNKFFSSVFTVEDTENMPTLNPHNDDQFLSEIILTKQAVTSKLKNLNVNKVMGPDKIPTIILKKLSSELSLPLLKKLNKSLSGGQIPLYWKTAEITAIYKKKETNQNPATIDRLV